MDLTEPDKKTQVSSSECPSSLDEQQILEYWTEERIKNASPLPLPTLSQTITEKDSEAKEGEQSSGK
jgi:hypothetical protein